MAAAGSRHAQRLAFVRRTGSLHWARHPRTVPDVHSLFFMRPLRGAGQPIVQDSHSVGRGLRPRALTAFTSGAIIGASLLGSATRCDGRVAMTRQFRCHMSAGRGPPARLRVSCAISAGKMVSCGWAHVRLE